MAQRKKKSDDLIVYTPEQLERIERHIEENFGEIETWLREVSPKNISVNLYVIPPSRERRYITVVTVGMGARKMNIPPREDGCKMPDRIELILYLPAAWDVKSSDVKDVWPMHLLAQIARLPIKEDAWLGVGHSIDYGSGFSEDTELSGIMLMSPESDKALRCDIGNGERVLFYQVMLLHDIELRYKQFYDSYALVQRLGNPPDFVVDLDRKPVVPENFEVLLDTVERHAVKIREKELDTDVLNSASHLGAFLRWMVERDFLSPEIAEHFSDEIPLLKGGSMDYRRFVINELGGELTSDIFNDEGRKFAEYYLDYRDGYESPDFFGDVDDMALDYFGKERYNSEEFDDEAYLFVPYGEEYFNAIDAYIDRAYGEFLKSGK